MVIQMKTTGQTEAILFFKKRVNVWSKLVDPPNPLAQIQLQIPRLSFMVTAQEFWCLSKCESEFETAARKIFIDGRLGSKSVLDSLLWPAPGDKNNTTSLQKSRVASSLSFINQDDNCKVKDQITRGLDSLLWPVTGDKTIPGSILSLLIKIISKR